MDPKKAVSFAKEASMGEAPEQDTLEHNRVWSYCQPRKLAESLSQNLRVQADKCCRPGLCPRPDNTVFIAWWVSTFTLASTSSLAVLNYGFENNYPARGGYAASRRRSKLKYR
jgi:hypothetical protein